MVNSLTWLFMQRRNLSVILVILNPLPQQEVTVWGIYNLAIISSGIVGAIFSNKIKRIKLFYLWISLGTIASSLIYLFPNFSSIDVFLLSLFCGISLGLGMPSLLAFFTEQTSFENRGSCGGVLFFIASGIAPIVVMLSGANLVLSALVSLIWRTSGLVALIIKKPTEKADYKKMRQPRFRLILLDKRVMLYFIPWLMFSFVYGFQKITLEKIVTTDFYDFLRILQSISGAISAFVSGFICDRIGRKRVVIYGFVSLGIAYGVVSITPEISPIPFYFYSIIDGIAWGIFITMFVLILWGDLSSLSTYHGEKYYALGSLPFFFADFTGFLFAPYVNIPATATFSTASFFLFLAVLPLMFAPETLPEKKIRARELKEYIKKAKKVKEKYD
jgi:MFS family permease